MTLALASSIETFLATLVTSVTGWGHSDVIPCQIAASPWTVGKSPASMGRVQDWAKTGKCRRPLLLILSLDLAPASMGMSTRLGMRLANEALHY